MKPPHHFRLARLAPLFAWWLVVSAAAQAPKPGEPAPAIRITAQVAETRGTNVGAPMVGQVVLSLRVASRTLPPGSMLRRINVTRIVDSLGNQVAPRPAATVMSGTTPPMSIVLAMAAPPRPASGPMTVFGEHPEFVVSTSNHQGVARQAEAFSVVEGTLDLAVPAEADGTIVRVPNIKLHPGRIELPALTQAGIVFHFLGDADSTEEAVALRRRAGLGSVLLAPPDMVKTVAYYIDDRSGLLLACELQDGAGRRLRIIDSSGQITGSNQLFAVRLGEPLADDTQLVFYLALPAALKSVPFRLENIPLP
jgi:hypothetical protein